MIAKILMAEAPNIEKTDFSRKVRRVLGIDLHSWEQLMLLSLGIAGLIAVAVFVTTASVVILQRHETSEAKKELEEYKLDAGKTISAANAVGESARADVEKAQAEIANANKAIAAARAETAKAVAETAKANERTAELKLALEREIAARQPRTISPSQHVQIVAYLKTASPKGDVIVVWKLFDEEAEKFGKQVVSVLADAGFNAKAGDGPMTFGERGAWIVVRDLAKMNSAPNAVGAIQGAFQTALNILFDGSQRKDPFPDLGEVVIAIGAKPF